MTKENPRLPHHSRFATGKVVVCAIWVICAVASGVCLLRLYGQIDSSLLTRLFAVAGRNTLRFEIPVSETGNLKEIFFVTFFLFSITTAIAVFLLVRNHPAPAGLRWQALTITLASASAAIYTAITHFGMRHFAPWDQAIIIDLAWRLSQGQALYGEFFNQFPPGHYLPLKFAFEIFGPSWHSIVLLTAIFSAVCFLWLFWLLSRLTGMVLTSVSIALATVATTGVLFSFWWYNPMSSLAACIFLLSAVALSESPSSNKIRATYLLSLILLAMMKPNLAAALIVSISIVLMFSLARRAMIVLSSLAFVVVNLGLLLNKSTLLDVIRSYMSIGRENKFFIHDFTLFGPSGISVANALADSIIVLIPLGVAVISLLTLRKPKQPSQNILFWLSACGVLSGLVALATNMELFISDGILVILAACLLLLRTSQEPPLSGRMPWQKVFVIALSSGLIAYGTTLGAARLRVWAVGPPFMFHEVTPTGVANRYSFFQGLVTGENFFRTMTGLEAVVKAYPNARVYFGHPYSFASAVFGKRSLTMDIPARMDKAPRTWPELVPLDALQFGDPIDVLVCIFACEQASARLGFQQDERLTLLATGKRTFFSSNIFVYKRPELAQILGRPPL